MEQIQKRTAVFFDIDGTLLNMHGAGRAAFTRAVELEFGWPDALAGISLWGSTDLDILEQIFRRQGQIVPAGRLPEFFKVFARELRRAAAELPLEIYPGIRELLPALSADPRALVGLVTGNVAECARIKLELAGLHGHFLLGAFGSEHADRNRLAGLALERARAALQPGQTLGALFLVGDTPRDIAAAHAIGAQAIAVATGTHRVPDLLAAGAEHALADLANTGGVLRILGLPRPE